MFPHTITIFHHSIEDGVDVYTRTEVPGWYWMHTAANTGAGKGTEKADTYKAISSQLTATQVVLRLPSWDHTLGSESFHSFPFTPPRGTAFCVLTGLPGIFLKSSS